MGSYSTVIYWSSSRPGRQSVNGSILDATLKKSYVLNNIILGSIDPKWRDKVQRGENATGSLVRTIYSLRYNDNQSSQIGDGIIQRTDNWGETTNHGLTPYNPELLNSSSNWSGTLAKAESAAITAIRNKIKSEQVTFGGMNFLAELRSTIRGLREPGKALVDNLNSLIENVSLHNKASALKTEAKDRKGARRVRQIMRNRKSARQRRLDDRSRLLTGKTFAETWLEFVFGWKPLMSDVKDIASATLHYLWDSKIRRVYAQSGDIQTATSTVGGGSNAGIYCTHYVETVVTVNVKYVAGIRREATGPTGPLKSLLNSSGGLDDLAPAIWELVPWSFLVDYVMNIGDIIAAATQSMVGVVWISKTTVITVERRAVAKPHKRVGFVLTHVGQSTVISKMVKITRTSVSPSDLGVPSLTFTMPGSEQLLNVAALLRSSLRK